LLALYLVGELPFLVDNAEGQVLVRRAYVTHTNHMYLVKIWGRQAGDRKRDRKTDRRAARQTDRWERARTRARTHTNTHTHTCHEAQDLGVGAAVVLNLP